MVALRMGAHEIQAFDTFLRQSAVYGLAFVFLAGVLALLLWVAWSTVSVLKTWLPKWFSENIDSQRKVASGITRMSHSVALLYNNSNASHEATSHMNAALEAYFMRNKEQLNVPSDVIFHIRHARKVLERRENFGKWLEGEGEGEGEENGKSE